MDNELLRFARLAMATARRVAPPRLSRRARPAYHPASLLAAPPLKEHPRLTYRGAEDMPRLAGRLRRPLGLRIVPDRSTPWWSGRRHPGPDVIAAALRGTVGRAGGRPHGPRPVALGSTGPWRSHASRYLERRAERGRKQRSWLEWALAMWVEPRVPAARRVRPGPSGDLGDPVPLRSPARPPTPSCRSSGSWPTPATTARPTTFSAANSSASAA